MSSHQETTNPILDMANAYKKLIFKGLGYKFMVREKPLSDPSFVGKIRISVHSQVYDSYEYDFNSLRVPVEVEGVRRLDTSLLFFLPAERRDFTDEMAEERIAILPPVLRVDILR